MVHGHVATLVVFDGTLYLVLSDVTTLVLFDGTWSFLMLLLSLV